MEDVLRIFDRLPDRDVVTWTSMIIGYAEQEESVLALEFYARMYQEGVPANDRTFVGALKACSSLAALKEGKQVDKDFAKEECLAKGAAIHSQIVKSDFESDVFVGNTLVSMYAKCDSMEDAWHVFDKLPHRDVVTWTSMILGHVERKESREAFQVYSQLQEQGMSPDSLTFAAILKACSNSAALETGKKLHSQISGVGFEATPIVATSLIDMYAKCGSMVDAQQLFDDLPVRDAVPWNALIAGYAVQGESECVFHLFQRMKVKGIQPNGVTFLSVLNVCIHVGLVDKGWKYFLSMSKQYGIIPTIEHYTCMVDLLGHAGQVNEAVAMVEKMPFQPNVVIWSTMLGACQKWKDVQVGRLAFENAMRLDEKLSAAYISMANIYADAHMSKESVQTFK